MGVKVTEKIFKSDIYITTKCCYTLKNDYNINISVFDKKIIDNNVFFISFQWNNKTNEISIEFKKINFFQ